MNTYALIEPVLVVAIVAGSILFTLRRTTPRLAARIGSLIRERGGPAVLAQLFTSKSGGCDGGCGACSGCGPAQTAPTQRVILHRVKNIR